MSETCGVVPGGTIIEARYGEQPRRRLVISGRRWPQVKLPELGTGQWLGPWKIHRCHGASCGLEGQWIRPARIRHRDIGGGCRDSSCVLHHLVIGPQGFRESEIIDYHRGRARAHQQLADRLSAAVVPPAPDARAMVRISGV